MQHRSITELEYLAAVTAGQTVLAFLLDPQAPWPPTWLDALTQASGADIIRFRSLLGTTYLAGIFRTSDHLASLAAAAVARQGIKRQIVERTLTQLLREWMGERLVDRCIEVRAETGLTMVHVQQLVDSLLPDVPVEGPQDLLGPPLSPGPDLLSLAAQQELREGRRARARRPHCHQELAAARASSPDEWLPNPLRHNLGGHRRRHRSRWRG